MVSEVTIKKVEDTIKYQCTICNKEVPRKGMYQLCNHCGQGVCKECAGIAKAGLEIKGKER